MEKNKKIESYKTLSTTDLLIVDRGVLEDKEEDALDDEINERQPFNYFSSELADLREMVEKLQKEFGKHDHKDSDIVIRKG